MKMRIKAAVIFRGYVESNAIAGVPVYHAEGFDSVEELLADLGRVIVDAHWKNQYTPECCVAAEKEHPEYKRCPECGRRLHEELKEEDGIGICYGFLDATCDSLEGWEVIEGAGWEFGSGALELVLRADAVANVHSFGAELMWHCWKGETAKLSHVEEGGLSDTPYSSVLKDHVEVGIRQEASALGDKVALYKEDPCSGN